MYSSQPEESTSSSSEAVIPVAIVTNSGVPRRFANTGSSFSQFEN
jgi:hypothetical protein